jgi:hypothetical protein
MAVNSAGFSKVPTNALYVNIADVTTSIFNADGTAASWANAAPAATPLASAGQVFRDMGKTVYLPGTPNAVAMQSTILRKVQWLAAPAATNYDFYGTGGTAANGFFSGYISLGGQTYAGGGAAGAIKFARAN